MRTLVILCLVAGCSAAPVVKWPDRAVGAAPALVPLAEVLGPASAVSDAAGAALAARAAALKARVALAQ